MFTVSESSEIDADVIKAAIDYNEEQRKRYDRLERYYLGNHDILERKKQYTRINNKIAVNHAKYITCLLYTSPSPRDRTRYRMPSSA